MKKNVREQLRLELIDLQAYQQSLEVIDYADNQYQNVTDDLLIEKLQIQDRIRQLSVKLERVYVPEYA